MTLRQQRLSKARRKRSLAYRVSVLERMIDEIANNLPCRTRKQHVNEFKCLESRYVSNYK